MTVHTLDKNILGVHRQQVDVHIRHLIYITIHIPACGGNRFPQRPCIDMARNGIRGIYLHIRVLHTDDERTADTKTDGSECI